MKNNCFFFVLICLILASSFFSCKGTDSEYLVTVKVTEQALLSRNVAGSFSDVDSVVVTINTDQNVYYTDYALSYTAGTWVATFSLPGGIELDFSVEAYGDDGDGQNILMFEGSDSLSIDIKNAAIVIPLFPVSTSGNSFLPKINFIYIPEIMDEAKDYTIKISFSGNSAEKLSYTLTADVDGGAFSPASGIVTLSSNGTFLLDAVYTSGAIVGGVNTEYSNSLAVVNEARNSISVSFDTVVGEPEMTGVKSNPAPVVESIALNKGSSDLTLSASISDDDSSLSYIWKNSAVSFSTGSTVATLTDYDSTTAYSLELVVGDSDGGMTTVAFSLPKNLFPTTPVAPADGGGDLYAFEGNYIKEDLVLSGNANWEIASVPGKDGSTCIQSGILSNSQKSVMTLTGVVPVGQKLVGVMFDYSVSSSTYDRLYFSVNGSSKMTRSGAVSWGSYQYDCSYSAGYTYILEWRYQMDSSGSSGSNCAWLDNLSLIFE